MLKAFGSLVLSVSLFWLLCNSAMAVDGKKLYTAKFCITCHGKEGVSVAPNYPNLAGQNPEYMKVQIRDIISGKRKNKMTLLMTSNPVVMKITDEEIAAVTEYLAKLK